MNNPWTIAGGILIAVALWYIGRFVVAFIDLLLFGRNLERKEKAEAKPVLVCSKCGDRAWGGRLGGISTDLCKAVIVSREEFDKARCK